MLGYARTTGSVQGDDLPAVYAKAAAAPATVVVRSGDTLSKIAQSEYGSAKFWPDLWMNNRDKIRNPNALDVGEVLVIDPVHGVSIKVVDAAYAAIPVVRPIKVVLTAAQSLSRSSGNTAPASPPTQQATGGGDEDAINTALGQCIERVESGGNPQVMNASGHWGLFQFSYDTWVGYGGAPSEFGNADAATQIAVFDFAMAQPGGSLNWTPYDGC